MNWSRKKTAVTAAISASNTDKTEDTEERIVTTDVTPKVSETVLAARADNCHSRI